MRVSSLNAQLPVVDYCRLTLVLVQCEVLRLLGVFCFALLPEGCILHIVRLAVSRVNKVRSGLMLLLQLNSF